MKYLIVLSLILFISFMNALNFPNLYIIEDNQISVIDTNSGEMLQFAELPMGGEYLLGTVGATAYGIELLYYSDSSLNSFNYSFSSNSFEPLFKNYSAPKEINYLNQQIGVDSVTGNYYFVGTSGTNITIYTIDFSLGEVTENILNVIFSTELFVSPAACYDPYNQYYYILYQVYDMNYYKMIKYDMQTNTITRDPTVALFPTTREFIYLYYAQSKLRAMEYQESDGLYNLYIITESLEPNQKFSAPSKVVTGAQDQTYYTFNDDYVVFPELVTEKTMKYVVVSLELYIEVHITQIVNNTRQYIYNMALAY